ncbi:ATP-binding protein [Asanoa sp. NPDC049573]|uniref:ATP-binding protein n=1 Tax=Asanoa sp. NPDC049573 TaxID=3155396 RepID=UPI00343455C4
MANSPLRCRVGQLAEATVVAAIGDLDAAGASDLRAALFNALADQPAALIVELSQLTSGDAATLTVLAAVARRAGMFPGVPFAVVARPGLPQDASGSGGTYPIRGTAAQALDAIADGDAVPTVRELLPPIAGVSRHARALVTEMCARWQLDDIVGPACVVVSELVSNAVRHAGTTMTLVLSLRGHNLLVSVEDGNPDPPRLAAAADPDDPAAGRGLAIVDEITSRWGWRPTGSGKVVWAVLRVDAAPGPTV